MPNQALILLLAVLINSQPAPSPSTPTASTSSVPQTQAQAPPTTPRNPRSRAPRPGSPRRIGIRLDQGPAGEWRISAVVPFSPAHRAGLQANDLILKVRGEEVSFDDPERFRELLEPSPVILTIERDGEETLYIIHKRALPM